MKQLINNICQLSLAPVMVASTGCVYWYGACPMDEWCIGTFGISNPKQNKKGLASIPTRTEGKEASPWRLHTAFNEDANANENENEDANENEDENKQNFYKDENYTARQNPRLDYTSATRPFRSSSRTISNSTTSSSTLPMTFGEGRRPSLNHKHQHRGAEDANAPKCCW